MDYPQESEQEKMDSEKQLLRLLIQGRAQEALMCCRNLENKSLDYLIAVEDLFKGAGPSEQIHQKVRAHLNESMLHQEGAVQAAGRLMGSIPKGSQKRGIYAEIISVLNVCAHRNALVRRTVTVALGKTLAEKRRRVQR